MSRRVALVLVTAVAVIQGVRGFLPDLLDPLRFDDDLCQHVWWTQRFADPGLFPDDPAADYFSSAAVAPAGYQLLYRGLVPLLGAQGSAETLPFLLLPVTVALGLLLFRRAARGSWAGAAAGCLLLLGTDTLLELRGGLPRSFALPLLMGGVLAIVSRRWIWLGVCFLLSVLLYPPVVVNLGLLGAVVAGADVVSRRRLPAGWPWLLGLGLLALGILLWSQQAGPEARGPRVTLAQARLAPELGPQGRTPFFRPDPVEYLVRSGRAGLGVEPLPAGLTLLAVALSLVWRRKALAWELWALLGTALAGFLLAHALLFRLYLPNRYVHTALPLFLCLWAAALAPPVLEWARGRPRLAALGGGRGRRVLWSVVALLLVARAVQVGVKVDRQYRARGRPGESETYRFLAGLPADTLIAAHPIDASAIPLVTGRSVLASRETAIPYHRGYYSGMEERIEALLEACYASGWDQVDSLRERYGVDVLVVSSRCWSDPRYRLYFSPFRERNRERWERGLEKGLVLQDPDPERVLFRSEGYIVLRVGSGP